MEKITSKTLLGFKFMSDPHICRDGRKLTFMLKTPNLEKNGYDTDIYSFEDDQLTNLTQKGDVINYTLDENGDVLFASFRDKEDAARAKAKEPLTVFWRVPLEGGEAVRAFEVPLRSASARAIGGGKYIIKCKYNNYIRPADMKGDVTVLSEVPYWGENGLGYTSGERDALFIFDENTGKAEAIHDPWFNIIQYSYADGKIAIVGNWYKMSISEHQYGLFVYDIKKKEFRELIPQKKMYIWGCQIIGDQIMFNGNPFRSPEYGHDGHNFYVIPLEGGEPVEVAHWENNVGGGNGTTDSQMGAGTNMKVVDGRWYFLTTIDDSVYLYSVSPKGDVREEVKELGVIFSFDMNSQRKVLCAFYGDRICELYEDGKQITHLNDAYFETLDIQTPIPENAVTSDGYDIHGWVVKPADYEAGKKYPAILFIHGGPTAVFSNIYHNEIQLWASAGYFVFYCNPRGSDGRGVAFRDLLRKHGEWDYNSIMDWLDGVLPRYGDVDTDRIGVTGGSYGGYMTNWIITQTDRFKCAVSQRSISDWITFEYTAIRGWWLNYQKHGERVGIDWEESWRTSPLRYANNCVTPTLFIQSDNDHICELTQALTMFAALKTKGCEAEICVFHGEDHTLSRRGKPVNRMRRLDEILRWFDLHLK